MKSKRDFKKELGVLMKEQLDAFNDGASEKERIAIFRKIQKIQKERAKTEHAED